MKYTLFLGLLCSAGLAAQPRVHGQFRGSSYSAVRVDPRQQHIDLYTSGRTASGWSDRYISLSQIPKHYPVVLNGTFFSLKFNEPAGPLIYGDGKKRWTPRFKRLYGEQERAVSGLSRSYLTVSHSGRPSIGNSRGRSADQLARSDIRMLIGGGGRLVHKGRPALQLQYEGFDERSGLREYDAAQRTGLGIDKQGRLWLVAAGLEGGGLSLPDFAALMIQLGSREAMFLDCGGSTALRVGDWQRDADRPLPTWIVVSPRL